MKRLARLLRCTEGHAYSAVIVGAIAAAMIGFGVPPMLRDDPEDPSAPTVITTTTIEIPRFGAAPPTTTGG